MNIWLSLQPKFMAPLGHTKGGNENLNLERIRSLFTTWKEKQWSFSFSLVFPHKIQGEKKSWTDDDYHLYKYPSISPRHSSVTYVSLSPQQAMKLQSSQADKHVHNLKLSNIWRLIKHKCIVEAVAFSSAAATADRQKSRWKAAHDSTLMQFSDKSSGRHAVRSGGQLAV